MQRDPRACERAADALESLPLPPPMALSPKERTLLIAGWGAALRPERALRVLTQAEEDYGVGQGGAKANPEAEVGVRGVGGGGKRRVAGGKQELQLKPLYGAAVGAFCASVQPSPELSKGPKGSKGAYSNGVRVVTTITSTTPSAFQRL